MRPVKISEPLRFTTYTDEFLCHHPRIKVQSLVPLRAQVVTPSGPTDDAVALAHLQAQRDAADETCKRAEAVHACRLEAALMARHAWTDRRQLQRRPWSDPGWAMAHACVRAASPMMPSQPTRARAGRAGDWDLLTRHIGTTHAAGVSARQLAQAQLQRAVSEALVESLQHELNSLRQAVRLDLAHGTRPSELVKHPRLKSRLDAVMQAHTRLQQALAHVGDDPDRLVQAMASLPPATRRTTWLAPARDEQTNTLSVFSGDVDKAGTQVSTCVL